MMIGIHDYFILRIILNLRRDTCKIEDIECARIINMFYIYLLVLPTRIFRN